MTGPHREGQRPVWRVAVVAGEEQSPAGIVYTVHSYGRAAALSCNMARDRRLYLHLEALPR